MADRRFREPQAGEHTAGRKSSPKRMATIKRTELPSPKLAYSQPFVQDAPISLECHFESLTPRRSTLQLCRCHRRSTPRWTIGLSGLAELPLRECGE